MSTGHRIGSHTTPSQLKRVENDRELQELVARARTLSRDFDIPYISGYSKDGKTIYIDKNFPTGIPWRGRSISVDPYLVIHETTEKALIDGAIKGNDVAAALGVKAGDLYYPSHEVATYAEEHAVEMEEGVLFLKEYRAFFVKHIKITGAEKIERVPHDLDLTPYLNPEDAQDRAILETMRRKMR